jgi:hypothetical protein
MLELDLGVLADNLVGFCEAIAGGAGGEGDDTHAGAVGGFDAVGRVFDDQAMLGRDV